MANALPATSEGKAQLFYVAYYGRPADPLGLAYWAGVIDAADGDLSSVSADFGNSEEANAVYGGLSTAAAVNKLYNQMFNRDAEPAGLAYWVSEINAGNVALSDLPLALYVGAQGSDLTAFENKSAVASAFTDALDTTAEILAYNGIPAMAGAADLLASVGADESTVETATGRIDDVIAGIGAAPDTTQSLTVGVDNLVGGAGFDRFNGGTTTLTLGDSIDGGAGRDELNLTLASNGGEGGEGLYAGFTVDNVETINVRAIGYEGDVTLEMTNVNGLQTLNVLRSTNELSVRDLQNIVDVNLDDVANWVGIDFDNQVVMGGNDVLNLSVREVGSSADGSGGVSIDSGIEVLNIDDKGSDGFESDFWLDGYGLNEINVTGGDDYTQVEGVRQGHLEMGIETGGGTTLDSTAYQGDLSVYTSQYDVDTIRTGEGDDYLYIDSDWDYGNSIETNGGNDVVVIDGYYGSYYGDDVVNGSISTGDGDDEVYVYNGYYSYYGGYAVGETGVIDTGNGDDYVYLQGGVEGDSNADGVVGQVRLGDGNDHLKIVDAYGSSNDIDGFVDAGAGDDLIQVYNGTIGNGGVLQGGEGNDHLELWNSLNGSTTVVTSAATITGIETLTLGNDDASNVDDDHIIDLDAFDEALATINIVNNSLTASGYDQDVTLTNLTTEAIRITSTNSDSNEDVDLWVSMKDASGDDDSLSVELFGGTTTSPKPFEVYLADDGAAGNEIEHLALQNNGVGNREIDTSQDFDKSLTVTGNSTSSLRVYNSTSQLVDASAYAGNFTIEVATAQDYTILTGSGNDTINLLNDTFTQNDTVDGGDGVDRIIVNESLADSAHPERDESFRHVSNVEELEVRGDDEGTLYVSLDDNAYDAGIERLIVADDDGEDANVSLNIGRDFLRDLRIDLTNGALEVDNDGDVGLDVYLGADGGRTLDFVDAGNSGKVNLTIALNDAGGTTDIASTEAGAGTDGSVLLNVQDGSIDRIVLVDSSGAENGAVTITVDDAWNIADGGTLTIDAGAIADNDIDSTTGGVYLDASAETSAKIDFTGSANDDEVYGGAMADTIVLGDGDDYAEGGDGADYLSGGNGNDVLWGDDGDDTIDGGAGDDHITGGLGKDVLTGGAGNDIFYFDDALESNGLNVDTITDFNQAGDDTLSFWADMLAGNDIVFKGAVANDLALLTALSGAGGSPSGFAEAVLQTTDNLLYIDLNNDGFINNEDMVIHLTGVTSLTQEDFAVHA